MYVGLVSTLIFLSALISLSYCVQRWVFNCRDVLGWKRWITAVGCGTCPYWWWLICILILIRNIFIFFPSSSQKWNVEGLESNNVFIMFLCTQMSFLLLLFHDTRINFLSKHTLEIGGLFHVISASMFVFWMLQFWMLLRKEIIVRLLKCYLILQFKTRLWLLTFKF